MTQSQSPEIESLQQLIETVRILRSPGGCPWDLAQTHQSLRPYLIEEAYEVLDVLDQVNSKEDLNQPRLGGNLKEELGDLFMQVLLHSQMASETKAFDIYQVAQTLNDKLIRRHPHVFGSAKANSEDKALKSWEKIKAEERAAQKNDQNLNSQSVLAGVPRGLPALQKAARVLEKVTQVGFQWTDLEGPLGKVDEELSELKAEIQKLESIKKTATAQTAKSEPPILPNPEADLQAVRRKVENELGDLLFTLCNLGYLLKVNPEDALRGTLRRFEGRFHHVETRLRDQGRTPQDSNLTEMDTLWAEAKRLENTTDA